MKERAKFFILLLIVSIVISFFGQGYRGLFEPDEGRYVECAIEMITSGDYLIPRLNGATHISKPPLTYWFIAASLKLFGKNEFAARFPNSFFFFLTIFIILLIGKNLWSFETGIISSLIYATSIFPFIGLNFVTTDTILTFFIWLYIYFFIKKNYLLMWISLSFSFLTKGPPGILPFIGILFFLIFENKKYDLKKIFQLKYVLIFLCISFSWYIAIIYKNFAHLNYFIKFELIGRITGIHHRNSGFWGWLIYIPIILFGLFPWNLYWLKTKFIIDKNVKLLIFIIVIPLIIFCIVRSRLPLYILPIFPALSLITGFYIVKAKSVINLRFIFATVIFLILIRFFLGNIPFEQNSKFLYYKLKSYINEKDCNIFIISSREHFGLNFYFNKEIKHLNLAGDKKAILLNFFKKSYVIIFDKRKIENFKRILKLTKKLSYKLYKIENCYIFEIKRI